LGGRLPTGPAISLMATLMRGRDASRKKERKATGSHDIDTKKQRPTGVAGPKPASEG